jgi:hypothetical protein
MYTRTDPYRAILCYVPYHYFVFLCAAENVEIVAKFLS